MNQLHGGGSFAHSGGDPLHRPVAHVTGDEDTWDAGFEQERIAVERPARRPVPIAAQSGQVRPGQNKTMTVSLDDAGEPLRVRLRADEDKERMGAHRQSQMCVFVFLCFLW